MAGQDSRVKNRPIAGCHSSRIGLRARWVTGKPPARPKRQGGSMGSRQEWKAAQQAKQSSLAPPDQSQPQPQPQPQTEAPASRQERKQLEKARKEAEKAQNRAAQQLAAFRTGPVGRAR